MNPLSPEELTRLREEVEIGSIYLGVRPNTPIWTPLDALPRLLDMVDKLQEIAREFLDVHGAYEAHCSCDTCIVARQALGLEQA